MKDNICNSDKYTYNKGYICLPIEIAPLPKTIDVDGNILNLKSTFHVSLLCIKNILEKNNRENLEQLIIEKFCSFISKNEISFLKFNGEFRFAQFKERKTIIARCEVSHLVEFINFLSKELSIEIPLPPTHVTLFTLQPDMGIGLNSYEELGVKSKIIDIQSEISMKLKIT